MGIVTDNPALVEREGELIVAAPRYLDIEVERGRPEVECLRVNRLSVDIFGSFAALSLSSAGGGNGLYIAHGAEDLRELAAGCLQAATLLDNGKGLD